MDLSKTSVEDAADLAVPVGFATSSSSSSSDHGWQKVTYPKRQRRASAPKPSDPAADVRSNGPNPFAAVEQKGLERHRALAAAAAAAAARDGPAPHARVRTSHRESDDEDAEDDSGEEEKKGGGAEEKKVKEKKPKKPKVTVAEAAAKIDAAELAAFLAEVTVSFESQPDILLMRFADYFGRAFAAVAAAQFSWQKMFKESPLAKIVDVPVSHIPEPVYKTAADWLAQRPVESLGKFVLWSLDGIISELTNQQPAPKGSKKQSQQSSPKAQVAIFVVLAITLRRKPDVLISLLPTLRDNSKYLGQEKLPVIAWMIAQACQGDLTVGMFAWARNLLPLISGKSSANPLTRDVVLQSVERIVLAPKARSILVNGAVKKGERLLPPTALEMLWRATFPVASARVKATERFEAVYPTLKEIALAGSSGSKAMKPVAQQLLSISMKAIRDDSPELSKEATSIFTWCLIQNIDCFKQWEKNHLENVEATAAVLKLISMEWNNYSNIFPPAILKETLQDIRLKNEEALDDEGDAKEQASIKEANKYCKVILGRLSRRSKFMKAGAILVTLGVVAGAVAISPNVENWDLQKLYATFISQMPFNQV